MKHVPTRTSKKNRQRKARAVWCIRPHSPAILKCPVTAAAVPMETSTKRAVWCIS